MPRRTTLVALATVSALALSSLAAAEPIREDRPAQATVTYLGNEGVLLQAGRHKVLIDALMGDGLPHYPAPEGELRRRIETATGPFAAVDLVLASHHHQDHFDAAAVAGYLRANRKAVFISTDEAVRRLLDEIGSGEGSSELRRRIRAVDPPEGEAVPVRLDLPTDPAGLELTVWNLHHGRHRSPPVPNLGLLVEMNGFRALHVGDTEATAAEIAALGLAHRDIDLALLPYWKVLGNDGKSFRDAVGARHIGACHIPRRTAPSSWFGAAKTLDGLVEELARIPSVRPLSQPGGSAEF